MRFYFFPTLFLCGCLQPAQPPAVNSNLPQVTDGGGNRGPVEVPAGEGGGPCYGNNTCNEGLTCLSGFCVDASSLTEGNGGGPNVQDAGLDAGHGADPTGQATPADAGPGAAELHLLTRVFPGDGGSKISSSGKVMSVALRRALPCSPNLLKA